jgi:hypothetical protein
VGILYEYVLWSFRGVPGSKFLSLDTDCQYSLQQSSDIHVLVKCSVGAELFPHLQICYGPVTKLTTYGVHCSFLLVQFDLLMEKKVRTFSEQSYTTFAFSQHARRQLIRTFALPES